MKIAVEGCCHGELDKIYETVAQLEKQNGFKVDILIICGDFQAVRNIDDLQAMAVPPKFQKLNTFYKYYSGEKQAPILTIIIGGNHEASNYLQELPYGGWVAKNIYYLGYAGVIQVGGVRIGGISGIYKGHDFNKGHFEYPPYDDSTKRSVYHVRNIEVFRLKQIKRHLDIFISHDWPTGVYNYGDVEQLLKFKPFFRKEIEENRLGSKPCADLLTHLQPSYWFAAHLHAKFAAHVQHATDDNGQTKSTKFLALDKCLPRRRFLQLLDIPHNDDEGLKVKLDPEWLKIVQSTNHLMSMSSQNRFMPGPGGLERFDYTVSDDKMEEIREIFGGDMTLPENFMQTAPPFIGNPNQARRHRPSPLSVRINPQTTLLCTMLDVTDPNAKLLGKSSQEILEESDIGLPQGEDDIDDEVSSDKDDDNEKEDSDEKEMGNTTCNPSFINSSLDLSQSSCSFSSNISMSWDPVSESQKDSESSILATPKRPPNIMEVADDDEEFMTILSAQKSKSLPPLVKDVGNDNKDDKRLSSPALPPPMSRSLTSPAMSSSVGSSSLNRKTQKLSVADRLKAFNTRMNLNNDIGEDSSNGNIPNPQNDLSSRLDSYIDSSVHQSLKKTDTLDCQGAETRTQLEAICSTSNVNNNLVLNSHQKSNSPQQSSCSDSDISTSSPASLQSSTSPKDRSSPSLLKRNSSGIGDCGIESPNTAASAVKERGGSAKKLKRRNVSVYQECE